MFPDPCRGIPAERISIEVCYAYMARFSRPREQGCGTELGKGASLPAGVARASILMERALCRQRDTHCNFDGKSLTIQVNFGMEKENRNGRRPA